MLICQAFQAILDKTDGRSNVENTLHMNLKNQLNLVRNLENELTTQQLGTV